MEKMTLENHKIVFEDGHGNDLLIQRWLDQSTVYCVDLSKNKIGLRDIKELKPKRRFIES